MATIIPLPVTQHDWYEIPSRIVARKWCRNCGVYCDSTTVWSHGIPPWREDFNYVISGPNAIMLKSEPPCVQRHRWAHRLLDNDFSLHD